MHLCIALDIVYAPGFRSASLDIVYPPSPPMAPLPKPLTMANSASNWQICGNQSWFQYFKICYGKSLSSGDDLCILRFVHFACFCVQGDVHFFCAPPQFLEATTCSVPHWVCSDLQCAICRSHLHFHWRTALHSAQCTAHPTPLFRCLWDPIGEGSWDTFQIWG